MMDLNTLLSKAQKKLNGVHPFIAEKALQLVTKAHAEGVYIIITQGLRTIAEQNALYAKGRTAPGPKVTNAKGGYSMHNFALAFDYAVVSKDGKTVYWDEKIDSNKDAKKDYYQIGALGKSLGLTWGGDFRSITDLPHFEYTFGLSLADLRAGKKPPQIVTKTEKEVAGVSTYIDNQPPQNWRLQTGAFSDVATAEKMHSEFDDAFPELAKYSRVEGLRIVTGTWPSAAAAEEYKKKIKQRFGWWVYIKEA